MPHQVKCLVAKNRADYAQEDRIVRTGSRTYEAIREVVNSIPIVDTHEHLTFEDDWLKLKLDFGRFFLHYASVDLVSAGMPLADLEIVRNDPKTSIEKKWKLLRPYWKAAKNTAYCRAITTAIQDLYGLPDLNDETYAELCSRMRQAQKRGFYRMVLKDKANIAVSLNNGPIETDRDFMLPSVSFNEFVMFRSRAEAQRIGADCGISVYSIDELVRALDFSIEQRLAQGMVAMKFQLAYERVLKFDIVPKWKAEEVFAQVMRDDQWNRHEPGPERSLIEAKPLQDYMFHQCVQRAAEHNVPIQMHTGIQEGHGNYLPQTNPIYLTDIFMLYPRAKFDLFHIGYPYQSELAVLAKMFPNVYPDFAWMHVISPWVARQTLSEWLDTVPGNKILGFGGDYIFVEGAYAHSVFARENIARVLAENVDEGSLDLDEAGRLAYDILRNNASRLFGLERFGVPPLTP